MKLRRLIADALIVVVAISLPAFFVIRPLTKVHAFIPRGKLLATTPVFGCITNGTNVYATVTLPLSNAGPISIKGYLNWFDCRDTNNRAVLKRYALGPWSEVVLAPSATTNLQAIAAVSNHTLSGQVCCYSIYWKEPDSGLTLMIAKHSAISRMLGRGMACYGPTATGHPGLNSLRKDGVLDPISTLVCISERFSALTPRAGRQTWRKISVLLSMKL